jgi:hypothetical protein
LNALTAVTENGPHADNVRFNLEVARLQRQQQEARQNVSTREQAISAGHLIQLYEDNEIAADSTYKGQTFVITGKIDRIGKDILYRTSFE